MVDVAKDIYVRWNPGQPPAAPAKVGNVKRPIFLEPGSVMTAGAECYATSENTIRCDVGHGEIPRAPMHAPFSFDVPQGPPGEWNVPPPVTLIGEIRPGAQCVATGVGNTIRCDAVACPIERVVHGTVGAAPECAITCEAGYTREGTNCVPVPTGPAELWTDHGPVTACAMTRPWQPAEGGTMQDIYTGHRGDLSGFFTAADFPCTVQRLPPDCPAGYVPAGKYRILAGGTWCATWTNTHRVQQLCVRSNGGAPQIPAHPYSASCLYEPADSSAGRNASNGWGYYLEGGST